MTGLQMALASGISIALGAVALLWWWVPARPDPASVIANLADSSRPRPTAATVVVEGYDDRLSRAGGWLWLHLPLWARGPHPARELAILGKTAAWFYGQKLAFGLIGLILPALLSGILAIGGIMLPVAMPVAGSLLLGVALFFLPDYNVRDDAKSARVRFDRALSAYADLVAMERLAGLGPEQAMESAALGDSWVLTRIRQELARSRWSKQSAWDAMHDLSLELGLPQLNEIADIMRMSGQSNAPVYDALRAHARASRSAMLAKEISEAHAVSERMTGPMALTGLIFILFLVAPMFLRLIAGI